MIYICKRRGKKKKRCKTKLLKVLSKFTTKNLHMCNNIATVRFIVLFSKKKSFLENKTTSGPFKSGHSDLKKNLTILLQIATHNMLQNIIKIFEKRKKLFKKQ